MVVVDVAVLFCINFYFSFIPLYVVSVPANGNITDM